MILQPPERDRRNKSSTRANAQVVEGTRESTSKIAANSNYARARSRP